jgi:FixJ family two-component response regulator
VRLPGTSGLDLQTSLAAAGIHLPVILMTAFGDIPMTVKGMKAGAIDFLTKPLRDQDLLDAVAHAISNDQRRRHDIAESSSLIDRVASLSPRERQVMELVVTGLLNKQIAGKLDIQEVTVKLHRAAVMRKMGAKSIIELGRIAEMLKAAQGAPVAQLPFNP